jgi:cell division protein FtsZ
VITFSLDEDVAEMEIEDHIEVIPVLDYNKQGETRYSLQDYIELETTLTGEKSKAEDYEPKLFEDELIFEKRVINKKETGDEGEAPKDPNPVNSPIDQILKDRADERRRKLKDFNYKFKKNVNSIEEIEKEPAYKRQGVELEDPKKEGKVSRTSLSEDSNDEIQLRSNNSFLHDNVD